jgi:hypothetical protein
MTTTTIEGISIPDSKLAREVTELVRDTESPLLFHQRLHSATSRPTCSPIRTRPSGPSISAA